MDLKKKTFEDLIGNFADDAKRALDEILERGDTTRNWETPRTVGVASPIRNMAGTAGAATTAVDGLASSVNDLNETVSGLLSLPQQIAKLSALIEKLLPAVEALTGSLGVAGNLAGAKESSGLKV